MSNLLICPKCGSDRISRERRMDGNTRCKSCCYSCKNTFWDNHFIHSYKNETKIDLEILIKAKDSIDEIEDYCRDNKEYMWAATILGIIQDCDFRDAK